jgi:hypothetical protein
VKHRELRAHLKGDLLSQRDKVRGRNRRGELHAGSENIELMRSRQFFRPTSSGFIGSKWEWSAISRDSRLWSTWRCEKSRNAASAVQAKSGVERLQMVIELYFKSFKIMERSNSYTVGEIWRSFTH